MKSKGFTMIELLGIITILAVILLVSFPTLINVTRRDKERQYNDMVATLCKAGETYIYDNLDEYTEIGTIGNIMYIDIDELIDAGLVGRSQKNPKTESNISGNIKYIVQSDKSLKCFYDENMPISNMLIETSDDYSKFLNTNVRSSKIIKLQIHNDGINITSDYESTDCSYAQDESVKCYWKEDIEKEGYYEMNIAASGTIYTPYNSTNLFYALGNYDYDKKINKIDLTGINTKYTKNMYAMFSNVNAKELDLGNQFITKNVTNMGGMFNSAYFEIINLGDKFDTRSVTDMHQMFYENIDLISLNLGDKFDTKNVANMNSMFANCNSLANLDLKDKFDTSNVTDMSAMFLGLSSIENLKLGRKFDIPNNIASKIRIFYKCGRSGTLTHVIVPNQTLKDKILNLTSPDDVPDFWKENNGAIIQVES